MWPSPLLRDDVGPKRTLSRWGGARRRKMCTLGAETGFPTDLQWPANLATQQHNGAPLFVRFHMWGKNGSQPANSAAGLMGNRCAESRYPGRQSGDNALMACGAVRCSDSKGGENGKNGRVHAQECLQGGGLSWHVRAEGTRRHQAELRTCPSVGLGTVGPRPPSTAGSRLQMQRSAQTSYTRKCM